MSDDYDGDDEEEDNDRWDGEVMTMSMEVVQPINMRTT
jgi:hypothetical protein